MSAPFFPKVIDSTMVNDFRRCPTRWAERYINCLEKAGTVNVDLHFGSCFAKALEVTRREHYVNGKDQATAVSAGLHAATIEWGEYEEPVGHAKNYQNLILAVDGYFKQWPLDQVPHPVLNGAGIEYAFGIPLLGTKHPNTGEEVIYGGKFDMLGSDGIMIYPVDEKTTGSPFFKWREGWSLWGQFIGYQWACRTRGLDVQRLLVRGIYVGKNEVKFIQSFVSATEAVIERWLLDLYRTIDQMIHMYKLNTYPRVWGTACTVYRPCSYMPLCEATKREDWITMYNEVPPWNPLQKPGGEL